MYRKIESCFDPYRLYFTIQKRMNHPPCECVPKRFNGVNHILHRFKLEDIIKADDVSFTHLCFILQATGAVISGSTILKCLNNDTDDTHNVRDVDIYVEKKNAALLNALIYPMFDYSKIPLKSCNGNIYNWNTHINERLFSNHGVLEDYPEALPSIVGLYSYNCMKKRVNDTFETLQTVRPYQIIVLEDGVSPSKFVANFDLTICQNYFDGVDFVTYHPKCISTKKGYITRSIDEKRMVRINKYKARGYTILNS
jgi:hypothetical protein